MVPDLAKNMREIQKLTANLNTNLKDFFEEVCYDRLRV